MLCQSVWNNLFNYWWLASFRNPLEVSEDFAQEYNSAKDYDEKEKLEQTAQKMLERAKVTPKLRPCCVISNFQQNAEQSQHMKDFQTS